MFSSKTLTIFLAAAIIMLSLQTYSLFELKGQLSKAQLGLGTASASALPSGGSAPDMVGGC